MTYFVTDQSQLSGTLFSSMISLYLAGEKKISPVAQLL